MADIPQTRFVRSGEVDLAYQVFGAGGDLVTGTVQMPVLGSGIGFADRGSQSLKGVPDQWRLFTVEHA